MNKIYLNLIVEAKVHIVYDISRFFFEYVNNKVDKNINIFAVVKRDNQSVK